MGSHKSWWNWAVLVAAGVMSAEYVRLAFATEMSGYRYLVMGCWMAMFCFSASRILASFRGAAGRTAA